MSDKPVKPDVIYFSISDIPVNLAQNIKEDLKAIARLGDGENKKYDSDFDINDLKKFYELNPIADDFRVKDAYFDNFDKNDGNDYKHLYFKLTEAMNLYGQGTKAQFSIHDSDIPIDYRKALKDLAQRYPGGKKDIVEDMDLYTLAERYTNFPPSQFVSLETFQTGNGYDYDRLNQYLAHMKTYSAKEKSSSFQELIYWGRLIKDKLKIPFTTEYSDAVKLREKFPSITESLADQLFKEYPMVGLAAPQIISSAKGSTGYYLHRTQAGQDVAYPITNTTYLFPFSSDEVYVAKMDLRQEVGIQMLDARDKPAWNFTLDLSDPRVQRNLYSLLRTPFDTAKEDPLYKNYAQRETELDKQIMATKNARGDTSQLEVERTTVIERKKEALKQAINHAFDGVLGQALKDNILSYTLTGHCSLDEVLLLKQRLIDTSKIDIPQAVFDLMADALPDVKLSNTVLGIIPVEFDSDVPNYSDVKKQETIVKAFETAVTQMNLFPGDSHDHDQFGYLWTVGSRISRVKIVTQTELDALTHHDSRDSSHTIGMYDDKTQIMYVVEELFTSEAALSTILHETGHAAIGKMIDTGVITQNMYTQQLVKEINTVVIPRLDRNASIAQHTTIQEREEEGGSELLTNALKLYWINPNQLKQESAVLYHLCHNLHHLSVEGSSAERPENPFTLREDQKEQLRNRALEVWNIDIAALKKNPRIK